MPSWIALGAGAAVITVLELLQIPFETMAAALLPFVGVPGDLALDGAEAVIGPILVACLLLPRLTQSSTARFLVASQINHPVRISSESFSSVALADYPKITESLVGPCG